MNIFAISSNVRKCAEYLDSVRLNKMLLETTQLLSMYCEQVLKVSDERLYKTAKPYLKHPAYLWLLESPNNAKWLFNLAVSYSIEYTFRKNKIHACEKYRQEVLDNIFINLTSNIKRTPFANITDYKDLDVHLAYKLTLADKWKEDIDKGKKLEFGVH